MAYGTYNELVTGASLNQLNAIVAGGLTLWNYPHHPWMGSCIRFNKNLQTTPGKRYKSRKKTAMCCT